MQVDGLKNQTKQILYDKEKAPLMSMASTSLIQGPNVQRDLWREHQE